MKLKDFISQAISFYAEHGDVEVLSYNPFDEGYSPIVSLRMIDKQEATLVSDSSKEDEMMRLCDALDEDGRYECRYDGKYRVYIENPGRWLDLSDVDYRARQFFEGYDALLFAPFFVKYNGKSVESFDVARDKAQELMQLLPF